MWSPMTGTGITTTPSRAATGLVDQDAAKLLAEYAPQTVINLERQGVAFSRTEDGHIAQRRFGRPHARVRRRPGQARRLCGRPHRPPDSARLVAAVRGRRASSSPRNGM